MQRGMVLVHLVLSPDAAGGDMLVEIAAVRPQGDSAEEKFSELVRPEGRVPAYLLEKMGIDGARLRDRPSIQEVLSRWQLFVGRDQPVCFGAGRIGSFLRSAGLQLQRPLVDVEELARTVWPRMDEFSLESVAARLTPPGAPRYRALADALLIGRIWGVLSGEVMRLPFPVQAQAASLLGTVNHPLHFLFEEAVLEGQKNDRWFGAGQGPESLVGALAPARRAPAECAEAPASLPRTEDVFPAGGMLAAAMPDYECREGQAEMAHLVSETFRDGGVLMAEAGAGVGKSLAYLVPAVLYALERRCKVVLSTNTRNLQTQLYEKEIPLLRDGLGLGVRGCILKGRSNYLCLRKFLAVLRHPETELAGWTEVGAVLPLLSWLCSTTSGDISENTGFMSSSASGRLWELFAGSSEECAGKACRHRQRCFLQRARSAARYADVVIVNHALLLTSESGEESYLPDHDTVVLDEAHNIEDVATRAFTLSCSPGELERVTGALERRTRARAGSVGLLPRLQRRIESARGLDKAVAAGLEQLIRQCREETAAVEEAGGVFFESLAELADPTTGESGRWRLSERHMNSRARTVALNAARALSREMAETVSVLEAMCSQVQEHLGAIPDAQDIQARLAATAQHARRFLGNLESMLLWDDRDRVFWVEASRRYGVESYALCSTPLSVAETIQEGFFKGYRSVVLCSATLSVDGEFDFVRARLGLGPDAGVRTAVIRSPFMLRDRVRVLVPTALPDPGEEGFPERLSDVLKEAVLAAGGRSLALFTSYGLLNTVYERLRRELEPSGIWVIAQGRDGSAAALARAFRAADSCALLGTGSFWEGVDLPGEALVCLGVTRLPFHALMDPVFQARCEAVAESGQDAFNSFTLPLAVLKFKQGLGRLIRTERDYGVIVVTDKRVLTRGYGIHFRNALPVEWHSCRGEGALGRMISEFLGGFAA